MTLKKPTTKKLSRWQQENTIGYIQISNDEAFYKCVGYTDIYVSQYAQFIQLLPDGESIIRTPFYDLSTGYTNIVLIKRKGKKVKRTCKGIHDLVAQVWCEKPTFAGTDEPMQSHHKIKVKKNLKQQPISINFAENLEWVYRKYHKLKDIIRSIKVSTYSGNWKAVNDIEDIAKYYKVQLIDIYELLLQKPTYEADKLEYYEATIDNKIIAIEIRKFVTKKKK